MMTAQEARVRVDALVAERIQQEQDEIEAKITKSVEEGSSECWFDCRLSTEAENWLKSLGYKVSLCKDDHSTEVSW